MARVLGSASRPEWGAARALRYLLGGGALAMLGYGLWAFFGGGFGGLELAPLLSLAAGFAWSVFATYFALPWDAEHWPHDPNRPSARVYRRAALACALTATGLTLMEPTFFHLAFWLAGMAVALHPVIPLAWLYAALGLGLVGYGQGDFVWPPDGGRLLGFGLEALQFLVLTWLLFVFLREALGRRPSQPPPPTPAEPLSAREQEVLGLLADGLSNKQIAKALGLSEGTVKNYVSVILDKLQAENRTQAAKVARRLGLVRG